MYKGVISFEWIILCLLSISMDMFFNLDFRERVCSVVGWLMGRLELCLVLILGLMGCGWEWNFLVCCLFSRCCGSIFFEKGFVRERGG